MKVGSGGLTPGALKAQQSRGALPAKKAAAVARKVTGIGTDKVINGVPATALSRLNEAVAGGS